MCAVQPIHVLPDPAQPAQVLVGVTPVSFFMLAKTFSFYRVLSPDFCAFSLLSTMYSLPQTVTIPLLEIPVSMSTLVGLALLIILFFTFFSVTFKLGGGLSAASVAKTENKCDEGPTSFEQTGLALFSSVDSDLRTGITSFERDFMSGGKTGSAHGSSVGVTSGRTLDSL